MLFSADTNVYIRTLGSEELHPAMAGASQTTQDALHVLSHADHVQPILDDIKDAFNRAPSENLHMKDSGTPKYDLFKTLNRLAKDAKAGDHLALSVFEHYLQGASDYNSHQSPAHRRDDMDASDAYYGR